MNEIGFSTGAIAKDDFRKALEVLSHHAFQTVELSALRFSELPILVDSLDDLNLSSYGHVSFHAPSRWEPDEEHDVIRYLERVVSFHLPIVIHPDTMTDWLVWREFGDSILIENMDRRKKTGRTVSELLPVLDRLPEARLCIDLAHAKQVDPSLIEAYRMLTQLSDRVAQLHISDLRADGTHVRLTYAARSAYEQLIHVIHDVPVIIESPIDQKHIIGEFDVVRQLFDVRTSHFNKHNDHRPVIGLGISENWGEHLASALRSNGCNAFWIDSASRLNELEDAWKRSSIWFFSPEFCEKETRFVSDIHRKHVGRGVLFRMTSDVNCLHSHLNAQAVEKTAETLLDAVARRGTLVGMPTDGVDGWNEL